MITILKLLVSFKLHLLDYQLQCDRIRSFYHWHCWKRRFGSNSSSNRRNVRVRFAPSPTGLLHLGGFRTALLNYLFAKKHNGVFILRIEDTDQTRAITGASAQIEKDLEWLQIPPDESPQKGGKHGPYIQSERLNLYKSFADKLINSGHAYHCFCTEKRLELMKKNALRQRMKPMYDNKCRDLSSKQIETKIANGEAYCIRFKYPPPPYEYEDFINGRVTLTEPEGDFVILKSDKFPTYHLASVVDDHLMEITHILRGIEWSVSTGKHMHLYRALNLELPVFAHLPLLLNRDGSKLSKRQGDISIDNYRKSNYYPEALISFVLGSNKLQSLDNLIEDFDLQALSNRDYKLDFRNLDDLNQLYLKEISANPKYREENLSILKSIFPNESEDYYKRLLNWCPERVARLQDLGELYPFLHIAKWSPELLESENDELQILSMVIPELQKLFADYVPKADAKDDMKEISSGLKRISKITKVEMKSLMKVLRRALCGIKEGPPIGEITYLLGMHETIRRLNQRKYNLEKERRKEQLKQQ